MSDPLKPPYRIFANLMNRWVVGDRILSDEPIMSDFTFPELEAARKQSVEFQSPDRALLFPTSSTGEHCVRDS